MNLNLHLSGRGALFLLLAVAALLGVDSAWAADTIGTIADDATGNVQSVMDIVSGIAYLAGAFYGIRSAVLLKDHTDNPGQIRLSRPLVALLVSAIFLSLPGAIGMFVETLNLGLQAASGSKQASDAFVDGSIVSAPATATDLSGMAVALGTSMPGLKKLVSACAILAGAFLILRGIFLLPQVEQGRAEPSKVVWTLLSGVLLWSILPAISVAMGTIGDATGGSGAGSVSNILSYDKIGVGGAGGGTKFEQSVKAVLMFIQLLGLVAFVRGGLILKAIGEHKDGALGRAMAHILGGAAAMNITWAVFILANTIGAGWVCSATNPKTGAPNPLKVFCGK